MHRLCKICYIWNKNILTIRHLGHYFLPRPHPLTNLCSPPLPHMLFFYIFCLYLSLITKNYTCQRFLFLLTLLFPPSAPSTRHIFLKTFCTSSFNANILLHLIPSPNSETWIDTVIVNFTRNQFVYLRIITTHKLILMMLIKSYRLLQKLMNTSIMISTKFVLNLQRNGNSMM